MRRLALLFLALTLSACTPLMVQQAGKPPIGFQGARLETDAVVSFDGARLGLTTWKPQGQPWAVIVAVHGMNDYANAFHLAAPWWAEQGVATYAYDQRGFGRSPQRGIWPGDGLMMEDLRTVTALVRNQYPGAIIAVAGESMGGAVAAGTFASQTPPAADRLVLLAPAVWGWKAQPLPNRTLLWLAANFTGARIYEPPRWLTARITPTDNREELIAMSQDPLMIWGARSDTLYGLVSLMNHGADAIGQTPAPTLYLYGAHDQIIPPKAHRKSARKLKPTDRLILYPDGYHLLTRDLQGPIVWRDVLAWIRDPTAVPPSQVKDANPGIVTATPGA